MSPAEGYTFSNCRSMQNIQVPTQSGGVNKHVCKCIGKIDEQNYIIVSANGTGELVTKSTFLHNAKTSSSKIAEDKDRKSYENHPQGRCTSHVETTHQMLKCPEVMTDLFFTSVSTMPLECRTGIELDMLAVVSDSSQIGSASNDMRSTKEGIQECR